MRFVNLPQNDNEWKAWRRSGLGASEAPAVLGMSPWVSPMLLWETKTGRKEEMEQTYVMRRGLRMEPIVRRLYEDLVGWKSAPVCIQHDLLAWMRASLDGLDPWGEVLVEIKCPNIDSHRLALGGQVPGYYLPQVYHQLEVTGCKMAHYVSYSENRELSSAEQFALVEVRPHAEIQGLLVSVETYFMECVRSRTPPNYDGMVLTQIEQITKLLDLGSQVGK